MFRCKFTEVKTHLVAVPPSPSWYLSCSECAPGLPCRSLRVHATSCLPHPCVRNPCVPGRHRCIVQTAHGPGSAGTPSCSAASSRAEAANPSVVSPFLSSVGKHFILQHCLHSYLSKMWHRSQQHQSNLTSSMSLYGKEPDSALQFGDSGSMGEGGGGSPAKGHQAARLSGENEWQEAFPHFVCVV